jgi:hypothetical protein
VCGAELRPPLWKVLCGFEVGTCDDAVACVTRFRVTNQSPIDALLGSALGPRLLPR